MFGRKKKQKEAVAGQYVITLKGLGALAAIHSGLCEKMPDGSGWNIEPFMAFWDQFEKEVDEALDKNSVIHFS